MGPAPQIHRPSIASKKKLDRDGRTLAQQQEKIKEAGRAAWSALKRGRSNGQSRENDDIPAKER